MARTVIVDDICDTCDHLDLPNVLAAGEHVIDYGGQGPRKYDLCQRCEIAYAPFITVLKERGVDIEPVKVPAQQPAPVAPPKTAVPKKPVEKKKPTPETPKSVEMAEDDRIVTCPLPHKSTGGASLEVAVKNINSHASTVHRLKAHQVAWGDPENILRAKCMSHQECIDNNYGLTSLKGLSAHLRASSLPRIDREHSNGND